jgi:hypothetical protein
MLLDKYVLTKSFENLLSYHNPPAEGTSYAAPTNFVKRVNHTMNRIDPLLKTLQVRPSPPEGLVQAYLIHIGDRSDTNFKKILDLKGIRKQEQTHLLDLYAIHREGTSPDKLVQNSALLAPLMNTSSNLGTTGLASINASAALTAASGGLPTKFDAGFLGERLFNAAKEISTSTGGQGPTGLAGLTGGEKATINENLRNIGKFFKRDIGFGTRFGKRDGSLGPSDG